MDAARNRGGIKMIIFISAVALLAGVMFGLAIASLPKRPTKIKPEKPNEERYQYLCRICGKPNCFSLPVE